MKQGVACFIVRFGDDQRQVRFIEDRCAENLVAGLYAFDSQREDVVLDDVENAIDGCAIRGKFDIHLHGDLRHGVS